MDSHPRRLSSFFLLLFSGALLALPAVAPAADAPHLARTYTLDGEFVHDVGEIQLHVTNWGLIGSLPGNTCSFCDAPSAMWPADSGVDHVYQAGLWIGALLDGQPLVTTGAPSGRELRDDEADPLATIYEASEGQPGGRRYPHPGFDDDGDGLEDEDPLNGRDDDLDGAIDEDFAAISDQYFRASLTDDDDAILANEPDHTPLHLRVVQESFAWSDDGVDDFVGFEFTITASDDFPADRVLEDVHLGFYVDPDIGPRGVPGIASDDLPDFFDGLVRAPDLSQVPITLASAYDADGDGGVSPGHVGVLFFDRETTGFQVFQGNLPFDQGGDPTTDAERYALLSERGYDATPTGTTNAGDYRLLISTGPIEEFRIDDEIRLRLALVVGAGRDGLLTHAAQAYLTARGRFFDRDGDPATGDDGREHRVAWIPPGQDPVSVHDEDEAVDPVVASWRGALLPNVPNPFNPATEIRFRLPVEADVSLRIHDAAGRRVRSVQLGSMPAGESAWSWNGTDDQGRPVASGVYLVRLATDRGVDSRRIVLAR
jgi:hypothetical protein